MVRQNNSDKSNDPKVWQAQAGMELVRSWLGQSRACPACGRVHSVHTRVMAQAPGISRDIGHYLKDLGFKGRCAVVMDQNTRQAAGLDLLDGLEAFQPKAVVFDQPDIAAGGP